MRQIDENEFKVWSLGGNIIDNPYFVIVTTPGCGKCQVLKENKKIFEVFEEQVVYYEYKANEVKGASVLNAVGIMSVPFIIFRFKETKKEDSAWKLGTIIPDVADNFINVLNIFDALRENDQTYFGFNDFDEVIDKDNQPMFNRLLHLIYGEIDEELLKNRQAFINNLN